MAEPSFGRPVDPTPRPYPQRVPHHGRAAELVLLDQRHVADLWYAATGADQSFAYLRYGPVADEAAMSRLVGDLVARDNQIFWAVQRSGRAEGWLSLCDIYPKDASIEIGSIWFSPALQRTRASTETIFLLMRHAFDDLGYRRLVWRCSAENEPSLRAAARYGFVPEGIWRAAAVVKGHERSVAWHSMLAHEWPPRRAALEAWLDDSNFDGRGRSLSHLDRGTRP